MECNSDQCDAKAVVVQMGEVLNSVERGCVLCESCVDKDLVTTDLVDVNGMHTMLIPNKTTQVRLGVAFIKKEWDFHGMSI